MFIFLLNVLWFEITPTSFRTKLRNLLKLADFVHKGTLTVPVRPYYVIMFIVFLIFMSWYILFMVRLLLLLGVRT